MNNNHELSNIKDIAKLAGVSHSTVSRVINNSSLVKNSTREKVLSIIREYDFSPNIAAKALITGRAYTIGLLLTFDINQFPADFLPPMLQGMTPILNDHGYSLTLLFDVIGGQKNRVPMSALNKNKMDGIFILSVESTEMLQEKAIHINIPKMFLNLKPDHETCNYVVADEFGGVVNAVEHLIQQGHKKIGLLGGTPKFASSINRRKAFICALENNGIPLLPHFESVGYFEINKGYTAMQELLEKNPGLTAVFSANDFMALGAVKAIKERGMQVPDDIAIVGFDNQEFTEFVEPSLTTIKKPRTLMGMVGAQKLISVINGSETNPEGVVLPTELIIRESSRKDFL